MAVKEKILVVDDEPSIRKYLQTLLEVDGFEVEAVSSGKEALARVNKGERPDFIILDVLMPEMNGIETLKELMELDRSLNVIMLSCSKGRNQPFVKVNCAALPGELLESELFGFEQGAFTGAVRSKPGKFEMANKGTIFLDEIAEMSTHLQAKLLHVLQDHQYSRLGGRHLVETDVRVLAATNVDVHEAMKTGRFREDLYYRLNVLSINVPPLRERTAEIPLLFRHFLEKYSEKFGKTPPGPSKYLLDAAVNYPWRKLAGTGEFRKEVRYS